MIFFAALGFPLLASCAQLPPGCEYTYATVYQPPARIGDSGRLARVPTGTVCQPDASENAAREDDEGDRSGTVTPPDGNEREPEGAKL